MIPADKIVEMADRIEAITKEYGYRIGCLTGVHNDGSYHIILEEDTNGQGWYF